MFFTLWFRVQCFCTSVSLWKVCDISNSIFDVRSFMIFLDVHSQFATFISNSRSVIQFSISKISNDNFGSPMLIRNQDKKKWIRNLLSLLQIYQIRFIYRRESADLSKNDLDISIFLRTKKFSLNSFSLLHKKFSI